MSRQLLEVADIDHGTDAEGLGCPDESTIAPDSVGSGQPYEAWIVDYGTGRFQGGHQEDYLTALERALAGSAPRVIAPFRSGGRQRGRVEIYLGEFLLLWRLLRSGPRLLVFHTPEFRDVVLFAAASLFIRRRRSMGLLVLRRDGAGIVGRPGFKARILEALTSWLICSQRVHTVSDSAPGLAYWLERSGTSTGSLVSIPVLGTPPNRPSMQDPVIGLLGRFRLEKGAVHYGTVVRMALDLFPRGRVNLHLDPGLDGTEAELSAQLARDWCTDSRVEIRLGHLPHEEYARQLAETDIVVLPYDPSAYQIGTSGVLHDALALGRTVLATPIPWAVEKFGDHPNIVWLHGMGLLHLRQGLLEAAERHRTNRSKGIEDRFAPDWQDALQAAWTHLERREIGDSNG